LTRFADLRRSQCAKFVRRLQPSHLTLFPPGKPRTDASFAQVEVLLTKIRQNLANLTPLLSGSLSALAAWILFSCVGITILFAQAPSAPTHLEISAATLPETNAYANTTLTYKIIDAPHHTYGYDVFGDGRLMFHQTNVPALPGNEGFSTKEDATKVALLVIDKIRKGEMPPTISINEMKTLGVIK
jgi:hypothetical protein